MVNETILRKRKAISYAIGNGQSDSEQERDPFKVSDDDKDKDYEHEVNIDTAPKKKLKMIPKKKIEAKKKLTAKERIARLQSRIKKYTHIKSTVETALPKPNLFCDERITNTSASTSEMVSLNENLDHLFNDDAVEEKVFSFDEQNNMSAQNDEMIFSCDQLDKSSIQNAAINNEQTVIHHTTAVNDQIDLSTVFEMNKMVQCQLSEMMKEISSMRRQLARMESKGTFGQECSEKIETFVDFEESLALEGLPVKSIECVDNLELKLRVSPEYRKKLVLIKHHLQIISLTNIT